MTRQPAAHRLRPDPRHGLFETILVVDGQPIELDAHIARLRTSVRAVYRRELDDPRALILDRARGGSLGRLRLTITPTDHGGLRREVVVAAVDQNDVFPTGPFVATLTVLRIEEGQGDHKWADRDVLSRAEAAAGGRVVPVLVTDEGTVLEATRANLFIVQEGRLLTPPLDGRILPGVARGGVIDVARSNDMEVEERDIDLERLVEADEVFLTGSIRGVEPAAEIDGKALPLDRGVTAVLADELRLRWLGAARPHADHHSLS